MNRFDSGALADTVRGLFLGIVLVPAAAGLGQTTAPVKPIIYYVATDGNDAWSGLLPAPNPGKTDGPLATPTAARDAIRGLKQAHGLTRPVRVEFRGGTYRLTEPLRLGPLDSGDERSPIAYAAYPGEKPVLSGGRRITGWKPYKDRIVCALLPDVKAGKWRFRQLFLNGRRQVNARYPNLDPKDPLYGGWAFVEGVVDPTTIRYAPGTFPRTWAKPAQGELCVFPWLCWISDIVRIKDANPRERTISMVRPPGEPDPVLVAGKHYQAIAEPLMVDNRFYVQNLLEELDEPGEWYLDTDTGMVYFWPPGGQVEAGEVTAPCTDRLIEIRGTTTGPVSYIGISGLTFTQTLSLFPPSHLECNAPNSRGFTLFIERAEHCDIVGNTFYAVGGDAIRLENDNSYHRVADNEISEAGAMGINFNNTENGGFDFPQTWDVPVLKGLAAKRSRAVGNLVTRNHIHHCGVIDKFGAAIKVHGLSCVDNVISHNLIHDMPHAGIAITMGFGRNVIEYNHIHHICLEMADTGAFYSNRWFVLEDDKDLSRGTVVRYNLVHDVIGCGAYRGGGTAGGGAKADGRIRTPYYTFGIYFDNSPVHTAVYGNVVSGAVLACVAMPVAQAIGNVVENNVLIADADCQPLLISAGSGNRFLRNIAYHTSPTVVPQHHWPHEAVSKGDCDENLYYTATGPGEFTTGHGKIEAWHKDGYDAHSVVADPMFIDPGHGDYRLKPESPALRLGFKPIPMDRVGIKPD